MATYRFSMPAHVYFNIAEATDQAEAQKRADALVERLADGVELDNVDTEEDLRAAIVFPHDSAAPEVVNVEHDSSPP